MLSEMTLDFNKAFHQTDLLSLSLELEGEIGVEENVQEEPIVAQTALQIEPALRLAAAATTFASAAEEFAAASVAACASR